MTAALSGSPAYTSPSATEDVEPSGAQRRLRVEQGATFLAPPCPPTDPPPYPGRRSLAAGGLTFSALDQ